jgi:hypothetical protein
VSKEVVEQKDLDKRVRALTTLTKDHDIPALAADFFDSERPLPSVHIFFTHRFYSPCSCSVAIFVDSLATLFSQGHQFLVSRPPLLEEGPIQVDPVSAAYEAPEAKES